MFRSRAAIAAVALATAFVGTTGTSQAATASIRIYIPWTEQTVFALAPDRSYVAEWMGASVGWTIIGGTAMLIYAGSAGVFEQDWSGNIWMYNGTPNSWTEIGGPGYQFAEGGGHLYGIAPDKSYVAEWNGTAGGGWTIIGGGASEIAAGPSGLVEQTADGNATMVYGGSPGAWTQIGGVTNGLWSGNAIYRFDQVADVLQQWTGGTSWETIFNGDNNFFAVTGVGPAGVFVSESGATYKYGGTPNTWTQISSFPLSVAAVSRTNVFGGTWDSDSSNPTSVELYSGSGTTWSVIGGPAWQWLAAGD